MSLDYVHPTLGEEVTARAGYYAITKELRLKHTDREVLCLIGMCMVDNSCCGQRAFNYAIVPGYLLSYHCKENEAGLKVSEVEPISDAVARKEIAKTIEATEVIFRPNIEFW
jgi:hypothetical protein